MSAFIDLEQVWFSWPSGREVLRGVDLTLQRNDTLALMGSNGSGKTTLGKLIMGLLQPTAGKVCLDGRPVQEYSLAERGRRVGYVFQNPERQFFAASVADEIGFALGFRGFSPAEVEERVAELLAFFELEQYAQAFPFHLSHGEKQRLALAAVMALQPEFIILDEPSTGLDWARKNKLIKALEGIRERGVGYIIISHDHEFCRRLCRSAVTLKGGRLT